MKPEILPYLESAFVLLCSTAYTWAVQYFCGRHFTCIERRRKFSLLLLALMPPAVSWIRLSCLLHTSGIPQAHLSLTDWILLRDTSPSPFYSLLSLLWQCLFILWVLQSYEGKKSQKLLASAIFSAANLLLSHFAEALLCCLITVILHTVHTQYTLLSYGLEYLICFTSSACTIGIIVLLSKRLTGFFADRLPRWYLIVSVPLFGMVLLWDIIDLCASNGILLRGGDHLNPYYNELFSYAGLGVLSALCICAAYCYLFGMDRIDIEQKQKEQYRSQVLFYQMLETQYTSLEKLRHDMKNHIIGLQRLSDNQEWDKLTDYIHKMADFGSIEYTDEMTGRSVIDALLYYKRTDNIRWECDVHIPPDCPVDDFDLCLIFGNLLDNALEACRKLPADSDSFIKVHAHMAKKCLLIETANSMLLSGNRNDGIGLRNVRETAEKYNGTLQISECDHVFRASVLLAPGSDTR